MTEFLKPRNFDWIYSKALDWVGDAKALEQSLPVPATTAELETLANDRYLSDMSRRVFRAGLKHSLVDSKWPEFEKAFFAFQPVRVSMMSDDELDGLMKNDRIIRHYGKLKAVRTNAVMVCDFIESEGSVGNWVAHWPSDDIVALWTLLKKRGAHLGGASGPAFLRMVGKDTFLLTDDVVNALRGMGVVDKAPTSQRDLKKVQAVFNDWVAESGRPLCQISRLLSITVGPRN